MSDKTVNYRAPAPLCPSKKLKPAGQSRFYGPFPRKSLLTWPLPEYIIIIRNQGKSAPDEKIPDHDHIRDGRRCGHRVSLFPEPRHDFGQAK
ncbi:MAG TPA: hypothetical protein P5295_18230 [Spirochaetota bacterium]|nr:hypothetical protein [Spirochaetota bacterium]